MTKPSPRIESELYLGLLEELTLELQRAMVAVKTGALVDLEESLVRQQVSCANLVQLERHFLTNSPQSTDATHSGTDPLLAERIKAATSALVGVTRHYSMLLKHFGGTARLFAGMFRSYGDTAAARLSVQLSKKAWSYEL